MYPIFVQDSRIDFLQQEDEYSDLTLKPGEWTFQKIWECLNNNRIRIAMICQEPVSEFWNFAQNFMPIQAAGGLVYTESRQLLMIKRLGFWDLPKGKIDPMETPAQTAIREISEECGIPESALKIIRFWGNSFHGYHLKGVPTLKQSFWYQVTCSSMLPLSPQTEEGITEIVWADVAQQHLLKQQAWPAINWLLSQS